MIFLLPFEFLKSREEMERLVNGLAEVAGKLTSERGGCRGMNGSTGLGLHSQLCPLSVELQDTVAS